MYRVYRNDCNLFCAPASSVFIKVSVCAFPILPTNKVRIKLQAGLAIFQYMHAFAYFLNSVPLKIKAGASSK